MVVNVWRMSDCCFLAGLARPQPGGACDWPGLSLVVPVPGQAGGACDWPGLSLVVPVTGQAGGACAWPGLSLVVPAAMRNLNTRPGALS